MRSHTVFSKAGVEVTLKKKGRESIAQHNSGSGGLADSPIIRDAVHLPFSGSLPAREERGGVSPVYL